MNGFFDSLGRRPGEAPFGGHRTLDEREVHACPGRPDRPFGHGGGWFSTLPERFDRDDMPRGFGPRMPGGPGFPRGGMPPHGAMPPHGGMPPRRPSADFMRARIEEADLSELLMLAGRMARHRPQGDPAQGQNLVLSILAGREVLSQRALQLMLGVQPGSLSEILTTLERKGLITREKAEDRRGNLLRITDEGRCAIPDGEKPAQDAMFSALSDEQQEQLSELLRTLLNDWVARFDQPPRGPEDGEAPDPRGGRFVPLSDGPQRV